METSARTIGENGVTVHSVKTLIIGAGAAALNAAEHLHELGYADFVIVTSGAGLASDGAQPRASYYRMGMCWETPDSPAAFAKTLCDGGMTHGDIAYVEAVNSIPEFLHLVRNGVPFPRDEYGTYTGSGPGNRLATAGPRTSDIMAQRAAENVRRSRAQVLPHHTVLAILVAGEGTARRVVGALAIDQRKASKPAEAVVIFNCRNIILATGAPGPLFEHTVCPGGSASGHALALRAGAAAANLTETRFGLAFAKAKRPISGNYQRVIPNYFSLGKGGRDQRAFLADYFHAAKQIASAIFFKGESWPFSAGRLQALGASVLEIAVYNEIVAGRRVYVDFSTNVRGEGLGQFNVSQLDPRARQFLESSNTLQYSPYDRLRHLEPALIDTMADAAINLREPQEVAICAEETFGGIAVNAWWETSVPGLFAVGDVACTHGDPPEGAQLNAGQVGGLRAAERIARHQSEAPLPLDQFLPAVQAQLSAEIANLRRYVYGPIEAPSVKNVRTELQHRMDMSAGMIRGLAGITRAIADTTALYEKIRREGQRLSRQSEFISAVENELLCITQLAFLNAMKSYIEMGGGSRGAYLILDERGDAAVLTKRGSEMRHRNENQGFRNQVLEVTIRQGTEFECRAVPARPIPTPTRP